jgi:hypothetical protein
MNALHRLPHAIGPRVAHWVTPTITIVHCPRCAYAATAHREGQALNSLAAHLVRVHLQHEAKERA